MKRGLQHHCFINPKKSGWIIALLLLITLGISVVNLRKCNTRLDENETIEQEADTKEPELEVTESKIDYSYSKMCIQGKNFHKSLWIPVQGGN